jgi:DNA (cytosine-5)-methyltransferase 1
MRLQKKINSLINELGITGDIYLREEETLALITHIYNSDKNNKFYKSQPYITENAATILMNNLPEEIKNKMDTAPFKDTKDNKFRYIDLFAGIGGFRLALRENGGHCIFSSELDNAAKTTYFNNYGEIPFGDIRQFTGKDRSDNEVDAFIPDHDILTAGFPCQPFSNAGVSARNSLNQAHGFEDNTQGTLFHDIVRIANIKRPAVLLLENVRNIKSHDEGKTFKIIEESIKSIGYSFSSEVINAQTLVPQKRVRCYMVAVRNDLPKFKFNLKPFEGEPIPLKSILEKNKSNVEYQISEKLWQGHIKRTKRNKERGTGFTAIEADISKPSNTIVARYGKDGKECLIPMEDGPPRKLSKIEAARLQGFPEKFILPESKTPTYKQIGNSVAVPVVEKIVEQIISHLEENNAI